MLLVVDANILVGELLRERGRKLLEDSRLELQITGAALDETLHELGRRLIILERSGRFSATDAREAHLRALGLVDGRIAREPIERFNEWERIARRRIPRDPDDWPTVALALASEAAIWTLDADFLGCGVPTWTADTLLLHLEDAAHSP